MLAEEETIAESKSSNAKLMEFLSTKENLSLLISYATSKPPDDGDHNTKFKYIDSRDPFRFPFVATDILSGSTKLAEALITMRVQKPASEEEEAMPGLEEQNTEDEENEIKMVQKLLQSVITTLFLCSNFLIEVERNGGEEGGRRSACLA